MARLASLLLLSAIGASAHPSGHARFHNKQRQVENRDVGDLITAVIDGVEVTWTQAADYGASETPAAAAIVAGKPHVNVNVEAAATTPSAAIATTLATSVSTSVDATASVSAATATATATSSSGSSSSSSSSSAHGVTEFTSFKDYCSSSKKRATHAQIFYAGNTGDDSDYGCNIMLLGDSSLASQYKNTVKFFGGSEDMYCLVWNKIGKDGGVNGFFGNGATTFTLPAGGEQYVALDANTQGGGACVKGTSPSDVLKTSYGAIAMTWAEWDAENTSNNGWSGADASCIVAQAAGLAITGMEVCQEGDSSDCSAIAADAAHVLNAYTADLADADGIGLHNEGGLKITVNVGY